MSRRKKKRRRGSNTHGHGSSKQNRGAGSRGGRGNAGSGKKAGHKKLSTEQRQEKGFTSRQQIEEDEPVVVNLGDLHTMLPRLKEEGVAYEEDGDLIIDLTETAYDKVLGRGSLGVEATVKAPSFSSGAKHSLEDTGSTPVETSET